MPHAPYPFATLGAGLNLRDKADAVGEAEAIDLMDVEFTERGVVKERPGYEALTQTPLTARAASLEPFYTTSGTKQLIAGCGTRLEAIPADGSAPTSLTGLTDGTWDFVRFGGPNTERVYAGQGSQTLRRWDGTSWSAIANTPQAGALALMPVSNRLAAGRFNGTAGGPTGGAGTSSPSHVYFSQPGDPETWDADDYLQITPGDGEKVQAIVTFREFVFIFKETKFAVVYGESVAGDGSAVFDYRMVDARVGLVSPRAVAVSERGVYFLDRKGVYFTDGGDPALVSDPVRPIFQGGSSVYYTGGELAQTNITNCAAHFHNNRLHLAFPTSSANNRVLVYDEPGEWWSLYDMPAAAMTTFRPGSDDELIFARASGDNDIERHNPTITNDDGSAITSHWRGGWFDYGSPNQKRVAEVKVWGAGAAYIALSTDFDQDPGTLTFLDMNDPAVSDWGEDDWGNFDWAEPRALIPRLAYGVSGEGTHFSTYFESSALDSPWAVHRLNHHIAGEHIPSVIGNS